MSSHYLEVFAELEQNPLPVIEEAVRLLRKIAENILKNPHNTKVRTLQKSNATISNKILGVKGGKKCLALMGFAEKDTCFEMDLQIPPKHVEEFIKKVDSWKSQMSQVKNPSNSEVPTTSNSTNKSENTKGEVIKKVKLPSLQLTYSNSFLRTIERISHGALQYEDKDLQVRTKKLIPISRLEENAQKRLRIVQTHIKKNKLADPDISIQDMLILELLQWFKEDFFDWVDSPPCKFCGDSTSFSHMTTDPKLLLYTNRVELHRCKSCREFTPFPRYNDLNILLETRRGRCGEWANTFTLCCRSMGWDARYVVDEGDHVWTEVYSVTQKRWLHCDPCENICDTPLVYESGWNKKISYVTAYSAEEVQDVTWRYSSRHKEVLQRRTLCTEPELLDAIIKIRSNLQKNLSAARKNYLLKRNLLELVEFLTERKAKSEELHGRSSGSEVWRIARGEIEETPNRPQQHIWKIISDDIVGNTVTIRYSSSLNKYEYISGNATIMELTDWEKGTFELKGLFRKVEKDWKMAYLARREGEEEGSVTWKFDLSNSERILDTVTVAVDHQTYENGKVAVRVCSNENCLVFPLGEKSVSSKDFSGSQELTITANLSGGKGDTYWQHAQLLRQSLDSREYNFTVTFTFQCL